MDSQIVRTDEDRALVAEIIARAWMDSAFKLELMHKPKEVFRNTGINIPDDVDLQAHEDTFVDRHIVISDKPLDPRSVITELPEKPGFYQAYAYSYHRALEDAGFRADLTKDPTGTVRALGVPLPDGASVKVLEPHDKSLHFVLPVRPVQQVVHNTREVMSLASSGVSLTNANANANVNIDVNVQVNVNADTNVNAAVTLNAAAAVAVIVAVLI